MADFVQTMKNWRRMCVYYTEKSGNNSCHICPLQECGAIYEDDGNTDYVEIGEKVAAWAAEHKEPVYPTWGTWLSEKYDYDLREIMYTPIPADLAQKLGIEPKEE